MKTAYSTERSVSAYQSRPHHIQEGGANVKKNTGNRVSSCSLDPSSSGQCQMMRS
jgi:hypothetical protein